MDKPWKVVVAFVGVFVAGAVFGAFFSLGIGKRVLQFENSLAKQTAAEARPAQVPPPQRPLVQTPPQWTAPQLMMRFVQRLELTQDQQAHIKPLLQRAAEDFHRQQANNFREMNFILQRMNQDLKKELTPEQAEKLEKMEQRQREQVQKILSERFGKRGAGGKASQENSPEKEKKSPEPDAKPSSPAATPPPAAPEQPKPLE